MKKWFAVHTRPREELLAATNLIRQEFEVYCPRYLKRRSHARKTEWVPAPLFPRYLFAAFDPALNTGGVVRSTRGAIDFVRHGETPVSIPDAVIDAIRLREDKSGYVVIAKAITFKRGDRVQVQGAFASYEAIFDAQRDDDRVIALLSLMGRQVKINVPLNSIAPPE